MLTYDIVRRKLYVRHRIRYRPTMSYVVHVRCRMFSLTYDVVYDVYTRCRTSNIRCRTCTYDVDRTYDILRTMSWIHNLNIVRAMSYVRCDIRCRTSDLRCRVGRRTTLYVTYGIVGGKNPDVVIVHMNRWTWFRRSSLPCRPKALLPLLDTYQSSLGA